MSTRWRRLSSITISCIDNFQPHPNADALSRAQRAQEKRSRSYSPPSGPLPPHIDFDATGSCVAENYAISFGGTLLLRRQRQMLHIAEKANRMLDSVSEILASELFETYHNAMPRPQIAFIS